MADQTDKVSSAELDGAEKAYVAAVESLPPVAPVVAPPVAAPLVVPVAAETVVKAPVSIAPVAKAPVAPVAKAPVTKPATPKAVVRRKPASIKKPAVVVRKARAKPAPKPTNAPTPKLSVTQLKDKIMASKTTDFTATINKSMTEAVGDMQTKAQAAYDKGTGLVAEMTDLAKGNVEAIVESGKILASSIEGLSKSYAEEAKSAYETLTADIKEMAAIKSPTELFQLQGKIMRRNFDAMVANSSTSSESALKLANDVFAPVTARVNLTVEKLSKAA
jgi:phasin family protein